MASPLGPIALVMGMRNVPLSAGVDLLGTESPIPLTWARKIWCFGAESSILATPTPEGSGAGSGKAPERGVPHGGNPDRIIRLATGRVNMDWYCYIAWAAVLVQLLFVYGAARNYRYVRDKSAMRKEATHRPRVALIIPCKGLDSRFHSNIRSFLEQDYENYRLFFVVEDESDPALPGTARVAGQVRGGLACGGDSDPGGRPLAGLRPEDLQPAVRVSPGPRGHGGPGLRRFGRLRPGQLAGPARAALAAALLRRDHRVPLVRPLHNNLATLAMSAINGAVAQFLGNSPFNHAWGGSMAIRIEDFRRLGIPEVWSNTLSDDLSLSRAVKRAGMRITFVPECLVASFESTTWPKLFEFGRRQFLITRVYAPWTWRLGLLSSLGSVAGLWGGAAMAIYAARHHTDHLLLYAAIPCFFLAGQTRPGRAAAVDRRTGPQDPSAPVVPRRPGGHPGLLVLVDRAAGFDGLLRIRPNDPLARHPL